MRAKTKFLICKTVWAIIAVALGIFQLNRWSIYGGLSGISILLTLVEYIFVYYIGCSATMCVLEEIENNHKS